MHTYWQAIWLVSQQTCYSSSLFALENSGQKTPRTESPTSKKHRWTISNPKHCSFVAFGPPLVSMSINLRLSHTLVKLSVWSGASTVSGYVSEPWGVLSDLGFAEKQSFLRRGRLASGDLPLRQDGTDGRTDGRKLLMIYGVLECCYHRTNRDLLWYLCTILPTLVQHNCMSCTALYSYSTHSYTFCFLCSTHL